MASISKHFRSQAPAPEKLQVYSDLLRKIPREITIYMLRYLSPVDLTLGRSDLGNFLASHKFTLLPDERRRILQLQMKVVEDPRYFTYANSPRVQLTDFRCLREVLFGSVQVNRAVFSRFLPTASKLQTLSLPNKYDLQDSDLVSIDQCSGLFDIDLTGCLKLTDATIQRIAKGCTDLQTLNISETRITRIGLAALGELEDLDYLDLAHCFKIIEPPLADYQAGTKSRFAALEGCTNLRYLDVSGCRLKDFSLMAIGKLQLETLIADEGRFSDDAVVQFCAQRPPIQTISFENCKELTSNAATAVAELPTVRSVNFSGCAVTDSGVEALSKLPLQNINLSKCELLTNRSVVFLSRCDDLDTVKLGSIPTITDDALKCLARCTRLEALDISDCPEITDASLEVLAQSCHKLLRVILKGAIKITAKGISALERGCPNLSFIIAPSGKIS